ncbi:paraquat-inducible protein B [Methylococcaceae bacterium]|nr:paraquat-inducible protein B [Methylococcaceae bacterium]
MTDFNETYDADDVKLNKKSELSLIWFLPLIAILVSGWLIYKSFSEKGEVITISFPTAEGLDVDKTKIKYLDVEIGKVTTININNNLKTIVVTAQMNNSSSDYLKDNTQFWVVRPQVGLGGISGLGTLLSGAYIELKPGFGEHKHDFTGLSNPPPLKANAEGKEFILETNNLGSMKTGTPINFHGISVGQVLSHELSAAADAIRLTIFISKPYDQFIRKNTRFWIDSGVDLSASADGFKVRTGPLISLLSGGIAFRASAEDGIEAIQPENTLYPLFDTYEASTQISYTNTLNYVMYFNGSVRGLTEGAPVQLRGYPVGKVLNVSLELDEKTTEIRIPVIVELQPERIKDVNPDIKILPQEIISQLIEKGLRAQLQTGSLLTGQLLVDLDFHPKSKITLNSSHSFYPEFPTTASSLDQFTHSANIIMDKIAKLPLENLTVEINKTLQGLQGTTAAATNTLNSVKGTMGTADKTLNTAQKALSNFEAGATTHYQLEQLLQELTQAAGSVKQLTDYLAQHPESVVRGKSEEGEK